MAYKTHTKLVVF